MNCVTSFWKRTQLFHIGQIVVLLVKFCQVKHFSIFNFFLQGKGGFHIPRLHPETLIPPLSCVRALHSHRSHLSERRWKEKEGRDLQGESKPRLCWEGRMWGEEDLGLLLKLGLSRRETPKESMAKACGKMKWEEEEAWGRVLSARNPLLVLLFCVLEGIPIILCQRMKAWERWLYQFGSKINEEDLVEASPFALNISHT